MLSYSEMWQTVSEVVEDEGFSLFDLDMPSGRHGRLLIYITGPDGKGATVNLDDCARISRRLSLKLDVEMEDMPGSYVLEVSSPGINRRLRRPEHFEHAVGEQVKVNVDNSIGKARTIRGTVTAFKDDGIEVRERKGDSTIMIPLRAIKDAHIDFKFNSK